MVAAVGLRSKLLSLLENHKKLEHETQIKEEELTKVKAERQKIENLRTEAYTELISKERKFEEVETKLLETVEKISELQKSTLECQRTSEQLTAKLQSQDEVIESLQNKAQDAKSRAAASSVVYTETLERLRDIQSANERMEKHEEKLKTVLRELELEILTLGCKLRKMESLEDEATKRAEELEKEIQKLTESLDSANQRTREAEEVYEGLSIELAALDEEANDWTLKHVELKKQIDSVKTAMHDELHV
ncbi:hypothetical protein PHET_07752 [Paragonimus heterotremus]|uniref:Tropomyosin n=1 Tax=Paragonimus heterotremus TaxID=100268 RepID=A0A8J4TCV1_9TREM|nr:hypothetical protein PHET_07752 [Paragonimus heterotremus]